MSTTYEIACLDCKQRLWAGQRTYTYTAYRDDKGQRHLDRFLHEHIAHTLRFFSEHADYIQMTDGSDCPVHEFEDVKYPEAEVEDQEGAEMLGTLIEGAKRHPTLAEHRVREAFDLGRTIAQEQEDLRRTR